MGRFSHYQVKQGGSLQRVFRPASVFPEPDTEQVAMPETTIWNEPDTGKELLLKRTFSSANIDIASIPSELSRPDTTANDIEMTTFSANQSDENIDEFLSAMLWTSFLKATENK